MKSSLNVIRDVALTGTIVEATVLSVNNIARQATVNLASGNQVMTVNLGPIDPSAFDSKRTRLLLYVSRDGKATPVGVKPNMSSFASTSVTLGDTQGKTRFNIRNATGAVVAYIDSLGNFYPNQSAAFSYISMSGTDLVINGGLIVNEPGNPTYDTRLESDNNDKMFWLDASSDFIRMGDPTGGDYIEVESDGTIEFNGDATVWDDLRVSLDRAKLSGANTPTFEKMKDDGGGPASNGVYAYNFDDDDELWFSVQMPHCWKQGSTIYPHLHWCSETDATGDDVGIGLEYSRLGGGIGTRGPGEKKLEIDRRRIQQRITSLKGAIRKIEKSKQVQRKGRKMIPKVAVVGYTNAGKSSLVNALTRSKLVISDQLFSTLDSNTSILFLPPRHKVLISDTVGFLKNA